VLIAIAVTVPLLALYVLGIVLWLIITAIRLMIRSLKDALAVRPDFSKQGCPFSHTTHPGRI
jgi:hypothetical protein